MKLLDFIFAKKVQKCQVQNESVNTFFQKTTKVLQTNYTQHAITVDYYSILDI